MGFENTAPSTSELGAQDSVGCVIGQSVMRAHDDVVRHGERRCLRVPCRAHRAEQEARRRFAAARRYDGAHGAGRPDHQPCAARRERRMRAERALYDAVLAAPDDDRARDALAAHWQRAGDPRGDFLARSLDRVRLERAGSIRRRPRRTDPCRRGLAARSEPRAHARISTLASRERRRSAGRWPPPRNFPDPL